MAHPDRPTIPPPPPAMLARDTAEMRAALAAAIAKVAADLTGAQAGDETGPGRCYSGATVDAELAFALYREACARGLHHTSIEAQAIADVARFAAADDFASLDHAAALERERIARGFARPHRWIRALIDGANVRAQIAIGARDSERSFMAQIDGRRQVELRLEAFTRSWWPDDAPGLPARLERIGWPTAAAAARETPPRRRAAATTKPATKRRGKVR